MFRFVSVLILEVISRRNPSNVWKNPFRCRVTLGAYRPNESKQLLLCFSWNVTFIILTLLPPICHHHIAPHLAQSSPRHYFLALSIASPTSQLMLYFARSCSALSLGFGALLAMPLQRDTLDPFRPKDWKFAQASRLEVLRHNEREVRQHWFDKHHKTHQQQQQQQQEWAESWKWGSWWWDHSQQQWGADWWSLGEAWSSGFDAEPTASVPPAAQGSGAASSSTQFPTRTPDEDKFALRNATLTPASFMPQRHVTMALGRPVVVLRGEANPLGAFVVGCVVLGAGCC